jgi:hypothetical protein
MPAKSKNQATAAAIALASKRGETKTQPTGASAQMAKSMNEQQLEDFASGPRKGPPKRK